MKKIIKAVLAFGLCLLLAVPVWADAQSGKQKPDYTTDYYMIVESKAGGIDIYSQPDFDSEKLNDELIPNGTALHIEGEVVDKDSNRTWGYTAYRGMNGYAPLDDCKPAESRQEAIDSELYIAGRDNVDYNADYDVKAYDESGSQHLYQGPGEKYGEVPGVRDIENGETLHITQDAEMVDGSHWGVTTVDGTEGWMNLEKTEEWLKEHPEAQTESVDAEAAAENAVSAEPVEDSGVAAASKTTEKSAMATTPKATATPKVTATPKPTETPAPTAATEATETPAATATAEPEKEDTEAAQDETDAVSRQASGQDVRSTSGHWYQNPFIWIIAVAVLAVAGLLIYHYKKR